MEHTTLHVGLDAVDGASDALIQPAVELIYKDGTYDTNGNYVKFDETESITSKYSKVFNENGGWNTVINSAKTGAIFSAASEAGGVAKYFKYDDNLYLNHLYMFHLIGCLKIFHFLLLFHSLT